ncbi:Autotransporter adhesin [Xenorhabdus stockiae]|uniref:Autotransporter adhesin n=1 Tax=Xenorhabdus stockiae TaxID=351614 RepID=A0A2D0KU04_9GAMM|nr:MULTISPECIES: hypothetical protein [Xenorhabdus]PHM66795.1 Autotransporter adhesin [Xenorhabdus stockiae]PHM71006.1 Autotransporter adhesin [Xenorhabdus sp. KJ12.1]
MNPRTKAEQEILSGKPISAVVYIWYPCQRWKLGHTAIYVGGVPKYPWPSDFPDNPTPQSERRRSASSILSRVERHPSRESVFSRDSSPPAPYNVTERDWPSASVQHPSRTTGNNYVSFAGDANILRGIVSKAGVFGNTQDDFAVQPHLEYYLIGLDVEKMQAKKNEIYSGKTYGNHQISHSYNLVNKNCAVMVARILKAGDVDSLLTNIQKIGYGKNIYWTPKDIAQLCNQLRNNDFAVKVRGLDCPDKFGLPIRTMTGFR